ncbi:hypothetical protein HAX54_000619 [Datura stramonium]|uniref:Uncharacterized protein n=1 Tax=Datura stramonium TaxID=4076 RepID=A0ABS8RRZ0_DATST|nr:hypothetical protein [Datura stramonium]
MGQLKEEKETLQIELEALKSELPSVKEQLDSAEKEIAQLSQMQKATEEDNSSLSSKSFTSHGRDRASLTKDPRPFSEIRNRETEGKMNSALLRKLEEKEEEFSSQMQALTNKNKQYATLEIESLNELKGKSRGMEQQRNKMSADLGDLTNEKSEIESQLEAKAGETSEYLAQLENLKEELARKTSDGQRMLEEKEGLVVQIREEKGSLHKISELENALAEKKKLLPKQQIELLQTEKSQLELVIETGKQESTESLVQAENLNTELSQKIVDQMIKLKEKEEALGKFWRQKVSQTPEMKIEEIMYKGKRKNGAGGRQLYLIDINRVAYNDLVDDPRSRNQKISDIVGKGLAFGCCHLYMHSFEIPFF